MKKLSKYTYYIAHDIGTIYGLGRSPEEAIVDALEECPDLLDLDTVEASEELAKQTCLEGGCFGWCLSMRGHAMTMAEGELEKAAPLMDDAIREDLHFNYEPGYRDSGRFLAEYHVRHLEKFNGEVFSYD